MLIHEKDSAIATILTAVITIMGTMVALVYYLYTSKYYSTFGFLNLVGGYFFILTFLYYYFDWRYEYVKEE